MPYCPRCGIEADASVRTCPLCFTPIPELEGMGRGEPSWPHHPVESDPSKVYATSSELRSRAFLIIAGVLLTAAVAVLAADLVLVGGLTWSRWPLASLGAALALAAAVFIWHRSPLRWGAAWFLILTVLLVTFDAFDDAILGWAPSLGLPILAATGALISAAVAVLRRSRRVGYNLFGLIPALVAAELIAIDALVTLWTGGTGITWSVVTTLVLGPIALLFFFLHYAVGRTPDLRRIFHF